LAALRAGNLAVKFALEIAAIAAFADWGATVGSGAAAVLVGIAAPLIVVILWGRFAAPRATRRLPLRFRAPFELSVLALAALALLTASSAAAIAFASVFIINSVLLAVLGQWEA
jgi:hypothetical protein